AVREALPDLDNQIVRGEFVPLREWLRKNIHCHGKRFSATDLIERVTGKPPSSEAFLNYMETKFGALYDL
ncbi:MAG: carboxypeptidase M32, partial [Planctomycetota bacterium]|nr:carboxypeptidase M32 [Planctomycetota bacterium]